MLMKIGFIVIMAGRLRRECQITDFLSFFSLNGKVNLIYSPHQNLFSRLISVSHG